MQTNQSWEEATWMQAREHVKFRDMDQATQSAFAAERDAMWSQIPAHLQEKARKLAGH